MKYWRNWRHVFTLKYTHLNTPKQLMKYQIALSLYKTINVYGETLTFDQEMVMDQVFVPVDRQDFK